MNPTRALRGEDERGGEGTAFATLPRETSSSGIRATPGNRSLAGSASSMMDEATSPAAEAEPTLVVGVGASASGLEAFRQLLGALPAQSGLTFVLVHHPTPAKALADLLAPRTVVRVKEVEQGEKLLPDVVYLVPSGSTPALRAGRIALTDTAYAGIPQPIDHLFSSLARELGPRVVGLVLAGTGRDGSAGLHAIKAAGGLTIAQSPSAGDAVSTSRSALAVDATDLVLPAAEMPAAFLRYAKLASALPAEPPNDAADEGAPAALDGVEIERLAGLLHARTAFDLHAYKPRSVERRILRRMTLTGHDDLATYVAHLRDNPVEQKALMWDLLIRVTEFFRDGEAFEALRTLAIAPLVEGARPGDTIRAWVPGVGTGEEAYSIAIELMEALQRSGKLTPIQIFATDLDHDALAVGRLGVYPPAIARHVPPALLDKYFHRLDDKGYRVRALLRDTVSFAAHDLTKDPPLSRMDLVSCRNVLIYLHAVAQEHVLRLLHFSLKPDGCLFLGSSESTGPQGQLFATLSKPWRLFRKVGASRGLAASFPVRSAAMEERPGRRETALAERARRAVMNACVPPTIVVAESGAVLFMHGELRPFLRFPDGEARLDLGAMVSPDLGQRAHLLLHRCRREKATVSAIASLDDAGRRHTRITASPALELGVGAVVLGFEMVDAPAAAGRADEAHVTQLEIELREARHELRDAIDELEASNEQLRSSNEETTSMNEELQAANEELEVTTEELRSVNEQLRSLNEQLAVRERQQAVVANLGLRALEDPDLQGFLDLAAREVQETLGTDFCEILEIQPSGELLLLRAGVGWREGLVGTASVPAGVGSQAGFTLRMNKPVRVEDLATETRFRAPPLLVEHGAASGLTCVVRGGSEAYGVIGVHTRAARVFTIEDADFLQAIASVLAAAIHRSLTRTRLALEAAAAGALSAAQGLQDAAASIHAAAARELGIGVSELWEPARDGTIGRTGLFVAPPYTARQVEQELVSTRPGAAPTCVQRVLQRRHAEWLSSLQNPALFVRASAAGSLGLSCALALPILAGGDAIGVLVFFARDRLHADSVFLSSLESIGRAIGDFIRRRAVEEELREASRQKDEFLAMLGHELRNPLAAVRSSAELLGHTHPDDARIQRTQAILARQTTHMAKLLDGLLDVSRVVHGKIALEKRVVDLAAIVSDVVTDNTARLPSGLDLRVDLAGEPMRVEGDVVRLTQIADNLVSNAVKYTPPPGRITVRLAEEDGAAVLRVHDTGIGIEPALLPHVFEPFRQGQQSLDRAQGGLGLGLALVRVLAELHGGAAEAHSDGAGRGAEIAVRLPLASGAPAEEPESAPRASKVRVLVIEDNEDAAMVLGDALEMLGHEVAVAHRGAAGIEIARRTRPDVVLCDVGLPDGVTGYDVARALRSDAATQTIHLVALTGYGRPEDKRRCLDAGFDAHLTKPVSLDVLERVFEKPPAA